MRERIDVSEIEAQTKSNANNTTDASRLANATRQTIGSQLAEIRRLNEMMHAIQESSRQITRINKVIDEIAFQTNILALNAAVEAARAGVAAWVAKEQGAAELETVIRGVCQGYSWFPPDMLGAILSELRADVGRAREHENVLEMLSPRERDVLLAMMDGKRGRQIAQDLLISTDTVRTHTRNIFAKLDVHSRLEAVRVARAAGLRAPDQGK